MISATRTFKNPEEELKRDPRGLERRCQARLKKSPNDPESLFALGLLEMMRGQPVQAAGFFRRGGRL